MEKVYIVPIEQQCNCDCTFCISKTRGYDKDQSIMNMDKMFFDTLEIVKNLGIKKVEITGGGEPTLHRDIQSIIDLTRTYLSNSYIKIYTNGRLQVPIRNVDEINISLGSLDDVKNQRLMRYKDSKKILNIIKFYCQYTDNLRLSIPIVNGGIDSEDKMLELIEATKKYVSSYVVRTLYEGTPNMSEKHADFDMHHPLVKMEKDNCLCDFKNRLIMWSDSRLYTNWDLKEEYLGGRCYK